MRVFRDAAASRTSIASLGSIYALVVVLTILLINRILVDPLNLDVRLAWIFAVFSILFPLLLLALVGINLVRLFRDRRRRRPGSGFKVRLTGLLALVVLLAVAPQGIVSVRFLTSGLDILFRSETGEAIRRALDLTFDYYERQVSDVRTIAADGTLEAQVNRMVFQAPTSPPAVGPDDLTSRSDGGAPVDPLPPVILRRLPNAAALQVFDRVGEPLAFRGDRRFERSSPESAGRGDEGPTVARVTITGETVLQLVVPVALARPGSTLSPPAEASAMLTVRLPEGVEEAARLLTDAQAIFARIEAARPTFVPLVWIIYGVFTAPILLLAVLAAFFLSDRIMRPIESLEEATRRVGEGDYSVRILTRPGDDLGVLVVSFNRMVTELDRARRRMAQAEKVQAWQEIAQRLAHEVKNPLTPIRLAAERLQRRYSAGVPNFGEVLDRTVSTIVREVDALTTLLNEFRSFSRMPEPQPEPVNVAALFREAADIFGDNPHVDISLAGVPDDTTLPADRGQLRQVVVNLFANAVEAAGESVRITVSAHEVQRGEERVCRIRVEDDGPGIPEELHDTLFDPYVTSKNRGTGLGLAIVERIVFDHDGRISYESAPGSGTTFVIDLPMKPAGPNHDDSHR